jgi:hypothetical protein
MCQCIGRIVSKAGVGGIWRFALIHIDFGGHEFRWRFVPMRDLHRFFLRKHEVGLSVWHENSTEHIPGCQIKKSNSFLSCSKEAVAGPIWNGNEEFMCRGRFS